MTAPAPAPAPTVTASGLVYADVPNRAIAYIIDSILVGIVFLIIGGILSGMGLSPVTFNADLTVNVNYVASLILGVIGLVISGAYFIYMWTSARATVGMKVLGMQIGNAGDGATLTTDQAVRRYLVLAAPSIVGQVLQPLPILGILASVAVIGWFIYLVYTTAKSPTKQGFHDVFANTQVVKTLKTV